MTVMRLWIILAAAVGILLLFWIAWGAYIILTTDRPPYEVLVRLPAGVEIRQYEAQTWISENRDAVWVLFHLF